MVSPTLSRRSLLIGAGAAALVAACGGKKHEIVVPHTSSTDASKALSIAVPSTLLLSGTDQRVSLLLAQDGFIKPEGPVELAFAPAAKEAGKEVFTPFAPAAVHTDAGGAPAYVTITHRFEGPGNYWVQGRYSGQTAKAALQIYAPDDPTVAPIPNVGSPLINVATPTPDNHRGVEPICTRTPSCPWHTPSLDAALAEHKPIALLFATPKLCQTAVCGPALDTLLTLKDQFEPRVRFLHVEVYKDGSGNTPNPPLAPAVSAYHLFGEPILFLAGADGKVVERIDGLFGVAEAQEGLNRIVAGR